MIYLTSFLSMIESCKSSEEIFCESIEKKGENLDLIIKDYLNSMQKVENKSILLNEFEVFLSNQSCLDSVLFAKGFLRTSPPIKQVYLKSNVNFGCLEIDINLSIEKNKLRLEKIEVRNR